MTPVLTEGGAHFVTPMSSCARGKPGLHIAVGSQGRGGNGPHPAQPRCGPVLVAPATADLLAKMPSRRHRRQPRDHAALATDKPVVVALAMNVRMWRHAATQRNIDQLKADGITVLEPDEGHGLRRIWPGPLAGTATDLRADQANARAVSLGKIEPGALAGKHVLVTSRPHARANRPGASDRQPLLRQAGVRHRRRRRTGGRSRDRSPGPCRLPPSAAWRGSTSKRPSKWPMRSPKRFRQTSPSWVAVADWKVEAAPAKLKKVTGRRNSNSRLTPISSPCWASIPTALAC